MRARFREKLSGLFLFSDSMNLPPHSAKLATLLSERILLLDGAMGTMIQRARLAEEDYRGARFREWAKELRGNNDLLSLTQPQLIRDIHTQYLQAGADIIETNTFNSTSIALPDYGMEGLAREFNVAAASLATEVVRAWEADHPGETRFVAGVLRPTNKTASLSPDVNDPGFRAVTFDELVAAYGEALDGLLEGGIDLVLVETIFDTLNAKAALVAIENTFEARGLKLPVIISGTITDASGRTLSGQTGAAFYNSMRHAKPIAIGLNCALGAKELRPYVEELAGLAETAVSCHPNAGLPNAFGEYDDTPESMARPIGEWATSGWLDIVRGCCCTTPQHIQAMTTFLSLIASEPDISRVPVMIDSSKWSVIEAGLKCVQGKAIVNSISMKEGEEAFLHHARLCRKYGAAVVVMAFDEKGQADTLERRTQICQRAYDLLTGEVGFPPEDIVFDPNIFAIATGLEEHARYGIDYLDATRWIRANLPHAKVSGGVSNLSFSFTGNDPVHEAMNTAFLYHRTN